jgi:hypothetical protein
MVNVTSSMDIRLEYTIYTDMQRHRQMVCHKQDGFTINKLIADTPVIPRVMTYDIRYPTPNLTGNCNPPQGRSRGQNGAIEQVVVAIRFIAKYTNIEYVEESMQYGEVPTLENLKDWRWNKRIFILTGVTLAKGAKMVKSDTMPETGGGEANVESKGSTTEKVEATDFIFAYSVNEVFYHEKIQKPYRQGPTIGCFHPFCCGALGFHMRSTFLKTLPQRLKSRISSSMRWPRTPMGDDEVDLRRLEVPRGKSTSGKYIILVPQNETESVEDEVVLFVSN